MPEKLDACLPVITTPLLGLGIDPMADDCPIRPLSQSQSYRACICSFVSLRLSSSYQGPIIAPDNLTPSFPDRAH